MWDLAQFAECKRLNRGYDEKYVTILLQEIPAGGR